MKTTFIILLFLLQLVSAQYNVYVGVTAEDASNLQKTYNSRAIDIDGSTEYASKTTPSNLDLNGTERITTAGDGDFSTLVNWTGTGNHSIARSDVDKKTGTYSGAITATAAGDATTNYVSLPSSAFTTLVSGEKYTLEGWARGTGILGSDLMAGWNFTSGWTLVSATVIDNNSFSTTGSQGLYKVYCTVGLTYKLVANIPSNCTVYGGTSGSKLTLITGNGSEQSKYFVATETAIYVRGEIAGTYDITKLELYLVTQPSLTLVCGGQNKTISSISCVAGTFTKLVWNFQATASEVGQPFKVYSNQADVIYTDDWSLTQAYDRLKLAWIKTSVTGTASTIVHRYASNTGLVLAITAVNKLQAIIGDGTNTITVTGTSTSLCDGNWHLVGLTLDRIGNLQLYVDGVADGSATAITSIGNIVITNPFQVGYRSGVYFSGQIGEIQKARFTNITTSDVNASSVLDCYNNSIHQAWTNGTIVAWYKWRGSDNATMLQDYSASGNNLTGTNVTTADQVISTYPSK